MSAKRSRKAVEWKDTRMSFSKEYQYSLFVKNRCVFFHCLAKNVRKMINYAANFAQPNNICVIYVYGSVKAESTTALLRDKPNNMLLMIASDISKEDVDAISDFKKWILTLKKGGLLKVSKPGVKKSEYSSTLVGTEYADEPNEIWYKSYNHPNIPEFYRHYLEGMQIMQEHDTAKEKIRSALDGDLALIASFPLPCEAVSGADSKHDSELLNIIRYLYPYGVESDTSDEYAVKLAKSKKIVEAVVAGEPSKDIDKLNINFGDSEGQLCFWNTITAGASECLGWVKKTASELIKNIGCFNVSELWYQFSKPPFGAYPCNWYDYIFAASLTSYYNADFLYGDSISSGKYNFWRAVQGKFGFVFRQTTKQNEFRLLLAKLFDIDTPYETTQGVVSQARSWVTANIHLTPLDCIDHKLYEILSGCKDTNGPNSRSWEAKQVYWYEYGYEDEYLPWLKKNFDYLYKKIRTLDADFKAELSKQYGDRKAELFCKFHTIKGSAVGWLHTKELQQESVVKYMSETICLECGNTIGRHGLNDDYAYEHYEHDNSTGKDTTMTFSKKDIIGLNKKLLGRTRTDYFCIPCLCEILGTTAPELYEMLHDFKSEGCTLFQ